MKSVIFGHVVLFCIFYYAGILRLMEETMLKSLVGFKLANIQCRGRDGKEYHQVLKTL